MAQQRSLCVTAAHVDTHLIRTSGAWFASGGDIAPMVLDARGLPNNAVAFLGA
jgi:hypothetical protein